MSYFINRIYVENFKFIEEGNINLKNSNLVILDGPNGYGKTTIFDIIELAIVGRINRINSNQTDNSSGCNDILYLKKQDKDAIIKVEFISEDKKFTVAKHIDSKKKYTKKEKKSNNWNLFDTYLLNDFNEEFSEDKKVSSEVIIELFGEEDLDRFYNLFYYIQQEDSATFLKNSEKDRVKVLSKLFDTEKEEIELDKLVKFRDKVNATITSLKNNMKNYDDIVTDDFNKETIEYNQIIKWKNIHWDSPNINIDSKKRLEEYKIELENIKQFYNNFEEFLNYEVNNNIDSYLLKPEILKSYIVCKSFYNQYEDIKQRYSNMKFVLTAKEIYKKMKIEEILKIDYNKLFNLILKIDEVEFTREYEEYITRLEMLEKNKSILEKNIVQINKNRDNLNPVYEHSYLQSKGLDENRCLLCGNTYQNKDELIDKINNYTKYLEAIVGESYTVNEETIKTIKDIISNKLVTYIDRYLSDQSNLVDEEFYIQLNEYINIFKKNIGIIKLFNLIVVDETEYINQRYSVIDNLEEMYKQFKCYIEIRKYKISEEYLTLDRDINFKKIYKLIFDMKRDNIKQINLELIDEKIKYLNNQYYNNEYDKLNYNKNIKAKIDKLELLVENTIQPSIELYRSSIRSHYTKIIKEIEIPFYIYSGKIIQDYQRGLGIFIKEYDELKNLKFVSNNSSDHDAINYLSSGQLSALVISFTLALNKVYGNKNINTILIDDPVQTMDDINMMSFIELIRNEFENKQIIISTHEDEVSLFMRYKFLMHKLKETRVNVKSILK